ncbi:SpoVR family protein [Halocatena pleomorpha]|uniref:AbrB family transcriptional regulator n=1 Tax=Halocatena pleomorpha TaxID=1785090 RepID=A0A3P3R6X0_9EURY|nr:SpoVR family protein [Halocatena pleomorpha]RRJ29211.1 AbrB family transcriptional regulator [Halocatena pleomorpha]
MSKPSTDRADKQRIAEELEPVVREAHALAKKLGLDPYPVNYWVVDYDEMNALVAYNGFQKRYPHWRWGMTYDQQRKQRQFLGGKAYELVNNDSPAHAFLQESNAMADQKAVITHVAAHSDFFANNQWYGLFADEPNAARMLASHADTIESYMDDPEIDREAVEKWIDNVLCLEDCIDQHQPFSTVDDWLDETPSEADINEKLEELELSEEVLGQVFDEEWLDQQRETEGVASFPVEPENDLISFLRTHGMGYDEGAEKAVEFEDWQREIMELLRREAYYFAPQKMTKVLNEGWAAYWESIMMGEEGFAAESEFIHYADHQAKVLGSPGFNPYKLGKELWEYVENVTNRREVVEHVLRTEGVTWRNFHDTVDLDDVLESLDPDPIVDRVASETIDQLDPEDPRVDAAGLERAKAGEIDVDRFPWKVFTYDGIAERHYSLAKPQNRGFLSQLTQNDVERIARYMFDDARYTSIEEALENVDYRAGWNRMYEIRESHNDVTFLDEFLTQEFVEEHGYFTYEYMETTEDYRVTSTDVADVKKKLMLQFSNFGKPTVVVEDGNYNNRNELLLAHQYNGVMLDIEQAHQVLKRVFKLWGHPVNLKTIVKELSENDIEVARRRDSEPTPEETGKLLRYDGENLSITDIPWKEVEHLAATDVDYDTKPDDWLA